MLMIRNDQFPDVDRLARQLVGSASRPAVMPMDARRDGDEFVVELDLPGVDPDAIDLDVERNVLTVRAERPELGERQREMVVAERPRGIFSRQIMLSDSLDTDHVRAGYEAGVLVLRIPIAERAKPRKIEIASSGASDTAKLGAGEGVQDTTAEERTSS